MLNYLGHTFLQISDKGGRVCLQATKTLFLYVWASTTTVKKFYNIGPWSTQGPDPKFDPGSATGLIPACSRIGEAPQFSINNILCLS